MKKTFLKTNWFYFVLALTLLAVLAVPETVSAGVPLGQQLDVGGKSYNLLIGGWRIILALANLLVVIVLLFLAIANIFHLNYDTYQIKKSLPKLIIGIVLANFSFLICRMFVSSADVLIFSFTHGNPVSVLYQLSQNLGLWQVGTAAGAIGVLAFLGGAGMVGLGLLILGLVLIFLPFIVMFMIWFIMWIRVAAIYLLIVLAPGAFVCLGFAPTEKIFKDWWCEWLKFVYMYPIMWFVFWLAIQISDGAARNTCDFSMAVYVITLALSYFAFKLPFSLAPCSISKNLMSGWGKFGGTLAKWGWNGLQSGMERRGMVSPRAGWQAIQANWGRQGNRARAIAIENARRNVLIGGMKNPSPRARSTMDKYDRDLFNDEYAPQGTTAAGFRENFRHLYNNGNVDTGVMSVLMEDAMSNDRMKDIMTEISENDGLRGNLLGLAGKRGIDLTEAELLQGQYDPATHSKILRTLLTDQPGNADQEGLRRVNAVQENAFANGNLTAIDVIRDGNTGQLKALDRNSDKDRPILEDYWINQAHRADSQRLARELKPEVFSDPAQFRRLLTKGMFSANIIEQLHRSSPGTMTALASHPILAEIKDAILRSRTDPVAAESGRRIIQKLSQIHLIDNEQAAEHDKVTINWDGIKEIEAGAPKIETLSIRDLDLSSIAPDKVAMVTNQIQTQLQRRMRTMNTNSMNEIKVILDGNPELSAIKPSLQVHADWQGLNEQLSRINGQNYTEIQGQIRQSVQGVINQIQNNLANSMNSGVDVDSQINSIIRNIPPIKSSSAATTTLRDETAQAIRDSIKQSQEIIIQNGQNGQIEVGDIFRIRDKVREELAASNNSDPAQEQVELYAKIKDKLGDGAGELSNDQKAMIAKIFDLEKNK